MIVKFVIVESEFCAPALFLSACHVELLQLHITDACAYMYKIVIYSETHRWSDIDLYFSRRCTKPREWVSFVRGTRRILCQAELAASLAE